MQMPHCLTAVLPFVDDEPKPVRQSFLSRQQLRRLMKGTDQVKIVSLNVGHRSNVFFGNDKDMNWSLRINISKGQNFRILIDHFGLNLSAADFTKNTVFNSHFI